MNVGEDKGEIVTGIIQKRRPSIIIELGGYCGYSTILFAEAAQTAGGKKYFSLERSPKFAENIKTLVEFAGLGDFVEVVVGSSSDSIHHLHETGQVKNIDMMFLDHYKPAYTTDLKLCESLGMISKDTVLAADNVIKPGNPPYLKYVRSSVQEKRMALTQAAAKDTDGFELRASAQYGSVEELGGEAKGNPNLVYKSDLINSFEPSGVPVSFTFIYHEDFDVFEIFADKSHSGWGGSHLVFRGVGSVVRPLHLEPHLIILIWITLSLLMGVVFL